MNLAQMQHSINWWNQNGRIDISLLEKVLEAKKNINFKSKPKHLSIQKSK